MYLIPRRGRLPMVEAMGLAKDIDTLEEAEERAREFLGPDVEEST